MAITINLTRGRTATFPDGTSEEDIKRILDEDYPLEGVDIDEMVMSDPDFEPTFEQYKLFEQHAYDKDESMFAGMGEGLKHIAGVGWEAAKEIPGMAMQSHTPIGAARNIATGIESGMQGTRELLGMAAQSADPDSIFFRWKSWSEAWGKPTDKGRYEQFKDAREFQRRTLQMEDGRTMSIADIFQLIQKNPEAPEGVLGGLHFDFDDPHTQKRMKELGWEKGMQSEELVNTDFVRGAKYVTDPSMLIPGFGAMGKGASLGTKAAGATLRGTGTVMRGAGGGIYRGGIAAGEIAEGAVKSATGVSPGIIRGGAAAVGVTTPGGQLAAGVLAGARATEAVGTVLAKAGEVMAGGPTRRGVFGQVARDLEKGTLEYALARGISIADKPIAIAGQAAEAGIHGGLIGGGLGFLHAGPEGFGPGFGAGFGMGGTIGGAVGVGQLARGKNAFAAKTANDVLNQIKTMEPEQAAMFNEVIARDGIDVAARALVWGDFFKGRLGDADVRYYYNPNEVRGDTPLPSMTAGKPTIEINLAKLDSDYTVGHEIVHGLDHIEDLQPIMHQIRQEVAGMWIDGRMVEQGGMTPLALETRYVEYMHLLANGEAKKRARRIISKAEKQGAKLSKEEVSRIHAEEHRNALDKFMKQHSTAEKRALYVADEIMAEHMARLIKGSRSDAGLYGFDSITRRVLDRSLLKYKGTVLGGMIGRLTDWGIDPYDSMLFKNLEQAPPELNAMLRNLIRARNNLSKQIEVSDARPDIITKRELKHRLPELKRQGLVKQNDKGEWVLKDDKDIEATEVISETALMDILTKEDPDGFKVERIVDEKTGEVENVVTGRTFSPAQLEAINNSPAILPTVKENIGRLAKAVLDGDILNMDYYAATKTQKNRATGRYRSKYSSGIKKSNRNMLPYTLEVSKAGNFFGKAIDWTVLTNDIIALASKKKLSPWGNDPRAFINDFTAYLTNLATGGRQRSFEIFGEAKADFMHDIMAKKHRGGSKYVKNFRLDRMDGITPTGERARMNPEVWDLSTKRRHMPDTGEVGKVGTFKGGSGWLFPDGKFLNLGRGSGVHEAGLFNWAKANQKKNKFAKKIADEFIPFGRRGEPSDGAFEIAFSNGLTRVYEHGSFGKEIHLDGPLTGSQSGKVKRWAEDAGYAVYHQPMRSTIQRTITEPTGRFMPDTGEAVQHSPREAISGKAESGTALPAMTVISPELAARFMPDVNDPGYASIKGKMAFPMLADRMKVGEYVGRSGKVHELRGGPDHVDIADNLGVVAWAVEGGNVATQLQTAINKTDGVGLVVLQSEQAVSGNRTFGDIMIDELRYDASHRKKTAIDTRIREVVKILKSKKNKKTGKLDYPMLQDVSIKNLDDLAAAHPDMSFDLRGDMFRRIASETHGKTGGIFWRDVMRKVTDYQNKDGYRSGDIVKAIQFEKGDSIVDPKDVGTPAHPSYALAVKGRSLGNIKGRLSAYQVFRDAFNTMGKEKPGRGVSSEGKVGANAYRSMQMRSLTDPIFRQKVGSKSLDVKSYDKPLEFKADSGPKRAELAKRSEINKKLGARHMPDNAAYMEAANKGDTDTAQRMVDQAAEAAGYTVFGVHHGTGMEGSKRVGDFTVFDRNAAGGKAGDIDNAGIWFTSSRQARLYGDFLKTAHLKLSNPLELKWRSESVKDILGKDVAEKILGGGVSGASVMWSYRNMHTEDVMYRMAGEEAGIDRYNKLLTYLEQIDRGTNALSEGNRNFFEGFRDAEQAAYDRIKSRKHKAINEDPLHRFLELIKEKGGGNKFREWAMKEGYDGVHLIETIGDSSESRGPADMWIVFDPNQIKSADPITRDNAGNVIPLSERFQSSSDDIRYMPDVGGQDALGMFSAAERATVSLKQETGSAAQMLAMIKRGGVKQEELAELGLDQFLEGNRKVTKDEIIDHLVENQVTVEETVLGGPNIRPKIDGDTVDTVMQRDLIPALESVGVKGSDEAARAIQKRHLYELRGEPVQRGGASLLADHAISKLEEHGHGGLLQKFFDINRLDHEEIVRPLKTKHASYVEPGAVEGSYRELLLRLPSTIKKSREEVVAAIAESLGGESTALSEHFTKDRVRAEMSDIVDVAMAAIPEGEIALSKALHKSRIPNPETLARILTDGSSDYTKGHYGEHPNVLAHVRFNDRVSDHGKTLNIEEIQSDWHQEGRKKGYKSEADSKASEAATGTVPDAPFKTSWHELSMKRMIAYAVQNNYDAISWTKGETQYKRYGSSEIVWNRDAGGGIQVKGRQYVDPNDINLAGAEYAETVMKKGDSRFISSKDSLREFVETNLMRDERGQYSRENFEKQVDKMTDRTWERMQNEDAGTSLPRKEGMEGFYDRMLPRMKTWKKLGLKVEEGSFAVPEGMIEGVDPVAAREILGEGSVATESTHIVRLTPEVKAKVLDGGLARFMPDAAAPNTEKNQLGWSLIKGQGNKWRVYKPDGTLAGIAATKSSAERMFRTKYKRELRKADK